MQAKPIEIEPHGTTIKNSIIWLHGLGADGNDFAPIASELNLANSPATRFVFPTAPIRKITINNNMETNAWYDIKQSDLENNIDIIAIEESIKLVNGLIAHEITRGIAAEQIILAGFSQGGVIALLTALCCNKTLKGIIALSAYLPAFSHFQTKFSAANKKLPILMQHGLFDPIVPLAIGQQAKDLLLELDYQVQWDTYSMPHSVCEDELININRWLEEQLA